MKTLVASLSAVIALGAVGPVMAQDSATATTTPAELTVIRETDGAMTCPQMSEEAAQLSQTLGGHPGGGLLSTIGNVAKAGAATFIPGAGLLMAGADALTQPERDRKAAEARAMENRWYYLNGLYAGQKCHERADAVVAAQAAASTMTTTPVATAVPSN